MHIFIDQACFLPSKAHHFISNPRIDVKASYTDSDPGSDGF